MIPVSDASQNFSLKKTHLYKMEIEGFGKDVIIALKSDEEIEIIQKLIMISLALPVGRNGTEA